MPSILDRYLPRADITDDHETHVNAPAGIVYDTARSFDLDGIPLVHAIFWARGKILRSAPPAKLDRGLVPMARQLGWGTLEERPGFAIVMGAVTKPWEADPVFRAVPAERFAAFHEPGLVKIAWTLEAEAEGPARTLFRSQTRAFATDETARKKFRMYWLKFGVGVRLIRKLAGPRIRREAEVRYQAELATTRSAGVAGPI